MEYLSYERSGGIAGFRHRLEVSQESLTAFDKQKPVSTRRLEKSELQRLHSLVEEAKRFPPPADAPANAHISDLYYVQLTLTKGEPPTLVLHLLGLPGETSDGSAWGNLLAHCEALLNQSIKGPAIVLT